MNLYSAGPCDDTDPAPGARLTRAGELLGRLSPGEALALAAELQAAAGGVVYLLAADIAEHFRVEANTVQSWRKRYGPGRSPEAIAKAPTCPQPDPGVQLGRRRPQAVWREDRLGEWDDWKPTLPGHGSGGGRAGRRAKVDDLTLRLRAVKGYAFMDLPADENAAIAAFLDGGDPAELPERWRGNYEFQRRQAGVE